LWIHGGIYTASIFDVEISGDSDARPVIVRNWNNEHVQLVGINNSEWTLFLRGNYLWVWGMDVYSTVSPAQDVAGVVLGGYHTRLINNYLHDAQSTGVVSQQVQGTEVYGNIINYNGRQRVAIEGPGYGAYAQNVIANLERKSFIDNIIAYNWSWGLHFYTEGGTNDSIWAEGNAIYNSGLFWKLTSWSPQFLFQGPANANRWFNLRNNYMYLGPEHGGGGHYFGLFGTPITRMTMTNNIMVATGGGYAMSFDNDGGSNTVSSNVFAGRTAGLTSYTSNTYLSGWPTTRPDDIFVRRNKYESNRANIVAFNWDETPTITVNPNANGNVLNNGDTYVVKDGLNYWGANVASGTYNGGNITIPMTGLIPAVPIGATVPLHTAPRFATFVLIGSGLPTSAPSGTFDVNPDTLAAGGGTVTLSWTSQNATSASIDQGIGTVSLNGSLDRAVSATTTFTISLSGTGGTTNYSSTVVVRPPPPSGTFSVSPDTLPAGGGSVTLSWTSQNASSASIDQGIGAVALSGSRTDTVGATRIYTLTLTNVTGSRDYTVRVGVALPSGQGPQDITILGTPVALITTPGGSGNPSIEVVRDGITPPAGSNDPLQQYDTYTNGSSRTLDWIGYTFPSAQTFSRVIFQEGMHFASGGWFTNLRVQVRNGTSWSDVPGVVSSPPYAGNNAVNYEAYDLTFPPIAGTGIRIAGTPGGSGYFISVGELRVLNNGTTEVGGGPYVPKDFALDQNYPNPFNPGTRITFRLPVASTVSLVVYNILGQEIVRLIDGYMSSGVHEVDFSGDHLSNGVYLYGLKAGDFSAMRKMVLLK
jgi:hypothetical protein